MRRAARLLLPALLILPAALLNGCAAVDDVHETLTHPKQAPMGYPSALMPVDQSVLSATPPPTQVSANSLWRNGARTFFHDQRARNVGDILTVQIVVADSAQVSNETNRTRATSTAAGVSNFFGLESSLGKILPGANPASLINMSGNNATDGKGVITRSENVTLTVAAVVTSVLPNGNMVIQGRQEMTTNNEMRELTVAGIVRPEDISSSNTIKHTQIAEARISYGGKGDVSRIQKAPWGQAVIEKYSPF